MTLIEDEISYHESINDVGLSISVSSSIMSCVDTYTDMSLNVPNLSTS